MVPRNSKPRGPFHAELRVGHTLPCANESPSRKQEILILFFAAALYTNQVCAYMSVKFEVFSPLETGVSAVSRLKWCRILLRLRPLDLTPCTI